jgi:hypothetical protein
LYKPDKEKDAPMFLVGPHFESPETHTKVPDLAPYRLHFNHHNISGLPLGCEQLPEDFHPASLIAVLAVIPMRAYVWSARNNLLFNGVYMEQGHGILKTTFCTREDLNR